MNALNVNYQAQVGEILQRQQHASPCSQRLCSAIRLLVDTYLKYTQTKRALITH